jgi:hypothetical protein
LNEITRLLHVSRWISAAIIIFLVFAFQVSNIPNVYMHPDEELSYRATQGGLGDTLYFQQSVQDNQAPGWFVSFWAWRQVVGDAEYTSRVLGILFTVLTLAISYRLGRRWFGSTPTLASLIVLGVNHFFFTYSLDIRMYPLATFSAAFSMWMFERWRTHLTWRHTILYGVSVALMLYVHYLLVFLVATQILLVLLSRRLNVQQVVMGGAALVLAFLIWLPWFPTFVNQVMGLRNIELESGTSRGVAGIGVSTFETSPETIGELIGIATNRLPWLYGLALVVGLIMLWRRTGFWLALGWGIGAPLVYLIANLVAAVYAPRFVSHAVVGLGLAVGAALLIRPTRLRLTGLSVFVVLNLLAFPTQFPERTPYRSIFTELSRQAREGDVLYMLQAGENDGFVEWQVSHYLPVHLQTNRVDSVEQAAPARRVWLITSDLFSDQVGQVFAFLEPTHPVQSVIGDCHRYWCYVAQLMEAPPLAEPLIFDDPDTGNVLPFWGADIDRADSEQIDTRLWWRVEEPPTRDLSFGLHLLDANGALVAQNDGPIEHYGSSTVQTSNMQPETIYIDFRSLTLPPDLPPGEYVLTLAVYRPWDNVLLTLPDGSERLVLKTITIP